MFNCCVDGVSVFRPAVKKKNTLCRIRPVYRLVYIAKKSIMISGICTNNCTKYVQQRYVRANERVHMHGGEKNVHSVTKKKNNLDIWLLLKKWYEISIWVIEIDKYIEVIHMIRYTTTWAIKGKYTGANIWKMVFIFSRLHRLFF